MLLFPIISLSMEILFAGFGHIIKKMFLFLLFVLLFVRICNSHTRKQTKKKYSVTFTFCKPLLMFDTIKINMLNLLLQSVLLIITKVCCLFSHLYLSNVLNMFYINISIHTCNTVSGYGEKLYLLICSSGSSGQLLLPPWWDTSDLQPSQTHGPDPCHPEVKHRNRETL